MSGSMVRKWFLVTAAILAMVSLAGGVLYLLGHLSVDGGGTAMRIGVGVVLIASGLSISVGLWASRRPEQSGGGLIAAGAVPAAICFWWTGVVPIVALSVAFLGVRKARKQTQRSATLQ